MRVVHVWLQNSDHSRLHLAVKMVDEVEKKSESFIVVASAAKSVAGSSVECSESAAECG
jgi:hypothetical protein